MRTPRRSFLLCCPFLIGCGASTGALAEPPAAIHGGWTRESLQEASGADLPQSLQEVRAEKIWRIRYRGPRDISGIWIRYPNETVAFEAFQRLNKNPSIRPDRSGPLLVILNTEGVPPQKLGDFEEGIAKAIN